MTMQETDTQTIVKDFAKIYGRDITDIELDMIMMMM